MAGQTLGYWLPGAVDPPDTFLVKFDHAGNPLWGVQFGTGMDDIAFAVVADSTGGSFIGGATRGSLGGPNAGGDDAWLARCDSAGTRLWVRQLGTPQYDEATGVVADGEGGVFVAGATLGVLASPPPPGPAYAWVARYDGGGHQRWLRQFGTPEGDSLLFAAPDGAGGFFVSGNTVGAFGGPPMGEIDVWVARFDAAGNQLWARQVGTALDESSRGLCDDGFGGAFIAGFTKGNLAGPNAGAADAWVARYDASGKLLSILQFGSPGTDLVEGIARDGLGGSFVGGGTDYPLFGPFLGMTDIWIARTSASSVTWSKQFGTTYYDAASALAPAGPGSVYVTGPTGGNLLGGGGGTGSWDVWLARYDLCYPDCNADGVLTIPDFGCYQTRFVAADPYADCNADGALTVADFGCFQTKFVTGCP